MARNDVFEFYDGGKGGTVAGDVTGKAMVVGVCSLGKVGKVYPLDQYSDLSGLLGTGPLVDRLRHIFSRSGQDAIVLAVPVAGSPSGYIGTLEHNGDGPGASISGLAVGNADVVIVVTDAGAPGVAKAKVSKDGGKSFAATALVPENRQITIDDTGATLVLEEGDLVKDDSYSFVVRAPIGPVLQVGPGPLVTAAGTPARAAEVVLQITKSGIRNEGQYCLSTDGGDNFSTYKTIPIDGYIPIDDTGVTVTCPAEAYTAGTEYSIRLLPPVPTISNVIETLRADPIENYDPECIYVVGESDSVEWTALGVLSQELLNEHRPIWMLAEARLPRDGEDVAEWMNSLIADRKSVAESYVLVCAGYGEVTSSTGMKELRSAGGLLLGRVLNIPVQRDIGRVRDDAAAQVPMTLPKGFNETVQTLLEEAGFIVPVKYALLNAIYWGKARTLADKTSDIQYLEVMRVIFKAMRILRIAALKSLKDEWGDPLQGMDASGVKFFRTSLESALDSEMVNTTPKELIGYVIKVPWTPGSSVKLLPAIVTLIGVPIIERIELHFEYVRAGSSWDPRLVDIKAV